MGSAYSNPYEANSPGTVSATPVTPQTPLGPELAKLFNPLQALLRGDPTLGVGGALKKLNLKTLSKSPFNPDVTNLLGLNPGGSFKRGDITGGPGSFVVKQVGGPYGMTSGQDVINRGVKGWRDLTNPATAAVDRFNNALKQTGPKAGEFIQPVDMEQLDAAQSGIGGALSGQADLLAALNAQGGLGAQSMGLGASGNLAGQLSGNLGVGNQNDTYAQQQMLLSALANAGGIEAQLGARNQQGMLNENLGGLNGAAAQQQALMALNNLAGQQQAVGGMYGDLAQGIGPNPAQAALNQATGQNIANQAAMMAGQRGAGANVGLMARQAAQAGGGIQQQAVGQSAQMQAQQQLAALAGLTQQQQAQAATQGQIAGIGQGIIGQQQANIGQLAGIGSTLTGQQQAAIAAQAGQAQQQIANQMAGNQAYNAQANQMAGQQIGQMNNYTGAQQAQQNAMLGAMQGYNTAMGASQASINAANSATNAEKIKAQSNMFGGAMGGLGAAGAAMMMMAEGGKVEAPASYADGGGVELEAAPVQAGPSSSFGQFLMAREAGQPLRTLHLFDGGLASEGGNVLARTGAQQAKVAGDSRVNDTIPALLSEGEIVLPREVTMSKNPVRASADFVRKEISQRKKHA